MKKKSLQKGLTRIARRLALLSILVFSYSSSNATHMAGADLTYRWISGLTYQFTATLYRDCGGIPAQTTFTLSSKSASCGYNLSTTLNRIPNTGQEITFPCAASPSKCSGGPYPGLQKYEYTAMVTLPASCADWVFSFDGCCRNCAITTLSNPCGYSMYIEARMNNMLAPNNSSPLFTNIPVAFICRNQNFNYNHGVIDQNGDSLVYSFVTPKSSVSSEVNFLAGYSASNPLSSNPPITLNSVTGDILMHSTAAEVGVTTVLVKEYRNGNLIGSVTRDMQFWTTICSPNVLPTATGINGTSDFSIIATPGQQICFDVFSNDDNADQEVNMTWNNVIPGASFNAVGSPHPVGTFCWTPQISDGRSQPYTFTITVRDDNCPQNGFQTYSYSIYVPAAPPSYCSMTQGFYGNSAGKNCTGVSTRNLLSSLLSSPLEIGWSNNKLILNANDVNCILSRLPGNGTNQTIAGSNTCNTCPGIPLKGTYFRSTLLTQVITLGLNMRMDVALGDYFMGSNTILTSASDNCGAITASPVPNTQRTYTIPQSVITYLGQSRTVMDLFILGNKAVGGHYVPASGSPTLGDITEALGAINNAFDKCRIITPAIPPTKQSSFSIDEVNIYPNPAHISGEFQVGVPFIGKAKLQLISLSGVLVSEIIEDVEEKGQLVSFPVPSEVTEGVYILRLYSTDKTFNRRLVITK